MYPLDLLRIEELPEDLALFTHEKPSFRHKPWVVEVAGAVRVAAEDAKDMTNRQANKQTTKPSNKQKQSTR